MRRLVALVVAAFASTVIGCGADGPVAPTQPSIVGTWKLVSINGSPLPYPLLSGDPSLDYLSDQLSVSANGHYTEAAVLRETSNGVVSSRSNNDVGTYTITGSAAAFHSGRFITANSLGSGTWRGNTLTVDMGGLSLAYSKQ